MDLLFVTVGIAITSQFRNTYFPLYYPAILGLSLVSPLRRLSFAVVSLVAVVYAAISLTTGDAVHIDIKEEKILFIRIATMFAVVAAGSLMTRIERSRRLAAVEAETARAAENLELQKKAQRAELAAQAERGRIAREIHDGIAQSIYAISLNLETSTDLAERQPDPLAEQLRKLVSLANKTLLETRHYIYDRQTLALR